MSNWISQPARGAASCALGGVLALLALSATAQEVTTTRATELRADKLASSPVIMPLALGALMRLVSLEGGWALVEASGRSGWVRAGALNLQAPSSTIAGVPSGREASGNTVVALGIRGLLPRSNRHALIIGVSRYADPNTPPLPGVHIDRESATQMAEAMQVPAANTQYLQDEQATGANIRKALADLTARVEEGDRVFIHYSGHGTRYNDTAAGGCVEALVAYDGGQSGTLTNREIAGLLKPLTAKTDKLFVMYDACHSGGLLKMTPLIRSRGLANSNDEGHLRPKFTAISEECGQPMNVKSRNLVVESTAQGMLPLDVIHISAARDNEVSFDDEQKGGLATQFMRDCMLRDAKDLDGSGAISIEEIRQCAQEKVDKRLANDANFKPPNITLSGNLGFVPAWFSQAVLVAAPPPPAIGAPMPLPMPAAEVVASAPSNLTGIPLPEIAPVVVQAPAPLTGAQALRQMFEQRDAKRRVEVTTTREKLKIGQDSFEFSVKSAKAGYLYVALAGSDNKSLQVLFPNALDSDNRIQPGKPLKLPRAQWRIKAGGPAGTDSLLVLVADGPRDLDSLASSREGPFVASLNDSDGRAQLGALMTSSRAVATAACTGAIARRKNPVCSDAYGASLLTLEEIK